MKSERPSDIEQTEVVEVENTSQTASSAFAAIPDATVPQKQWFAIQQENWWRWLRTKTVCSVLSQLSIAVSFATTPFHAISSAIANNSAVFFATMYIFRKNSEVRAQNEKLRTAIKSLRQTSSAEIDFSEVQSTEPSGWLENLGTFELRRNPMLYSLVFAVGLDITNCIGTVIVLNTTKSSCTLEEQPDHPSDAPTSDDNSTIDCILSNSSISFLGKFGLAAVGVGAIVFAIPQIWAAHSLRQYQNKLTKELQTLQELKTAKLEELVSTKDQEIADLTQRLQEVTRKISVFTEQAQKTCIPTETSSSSATPSLATLLGIQRERLSSDCSQTVTFATETTLQQP